MLRAFRVPNIMKRAMRCHDFGSGREASRSQYLEYWQGERQSHGPKLVPAPGLPLDIKMSVPGLRPKSATRRSVEQGPRLRGCDRGTGRERVVSGPMRVSGVRSPEGPLFRPATRHPSTQRLEPAPPCAGHFVGRLGHIRDMTCAVLRVITNFGSQRTRVSLC